MRRPFFLCLISALLLFHEFTGIAGAAEDGPLALENEPKSQNFHLVGWVNTFVPGGGQLLLGHPWIGAAQALTEISTFGWGYSLSSHSPMTLDGVPDDIPPSSQDATKALWADVLQEVGIKYHMVNIFESYRQAAGTSAREIDQTPTKELFLAPFRWNVISEPTVYVPVLISAATLVASYYSSVHDGIAPRVRLNSSSNRLYAATYLGVYPLGSAAPEEMFYRGFLQNEFYSWFGSPYIAVPLSTLAYTLSHAPEDMPSAAITGIFLGTLTHVNRGQLSKAIAFHFWADLMAGLLSVALLEKAQISQSFAF